MLNWFAITMVALALVALIGLTWWLVAHQKKDRQTTQRKITDKALLLLFDRQPGGLLGVRDVAAKTGLTVAEARNRLTTLTTAGLLTAGMNPTGMRAYYALAAPLEEVAGLELSDEPFLTLGDLQRIFRAYDYRVSPHDLIMATNLPWDVIAREVKHFRGKGILEQVMIERPNDANLQFVLREDYHETDPATARALDLELKEILYEERFLV